MKALLSAVPHLVSGLDPGAPDAAGPVREHERRLAQMAVLNVIASVLLALAAGQGLAAWTAVIATMGYSWCGQVVFFALVRSGWSKRRPDPTLSFEQLMFAISVVVLSYGLLDIARGAALELLCLLLAFGMDRLSTRQLLKASICAVTMLALTSVARIALGTGALRVHLEVYNLLMAAVLLPVAIIAGGEISRLHRRQAIQRSELASTLGRLTELSLRDGLTGLTNRRHVLRMIEQTRQQVATTGSGYCVAMLDIDWFKRVNDGYGHAVGDLVLKEFASLMRSILDSRFTLARWGGEEFLLLMPACNLLEAQAALSACSRSVQAHDWSALAAGLAITFSAGIAGSRDHETIDDTLQRADRSLYVAKANGRNRTEVCVEDSRHTSTAAMSAARPPAVAHAAPTPHRPQHQASAGAFPHRPVGSGRAAGHFVERRAEDGRAVDAGRRPANVVAWLVDVVTSRSPDIRENLRLPLIACVLHAVWLAAVYFYAMPHGAIDALAGWFVIAYESACAVGFYAAIRSGWSRRFADGGLVLAQMLAASAIASFGYVAAPELRPSILHLLCVIQVFGMVTLRPGETRTAGMVGIVLLGAVIAWLTWTAPADLNAEILKLVLACTVIFQLSILSHVYSTLRERVHSDRLQLEQAVVQVEEQVMRDPLTGLLNRRYMEQALAARHAAWLAGNGDFCLGILDLDHFKTINDEKGHHIGDAVLVALAQAAAQTLRDSDLICRWGGEEFICLLQGSAPESASRATLRRLRSAFAQASANVPGLGQTVTFSTGFARPRDGVALEELIAQADRALYDAKRGGRDRDVFAYEPSDRAERVPAASIATR